MDLLEYQGKQLFARAGIPVPGGQPARTVDEAVAAAKEVGFPCAIKAQVKIGGRGKAGGIKIAKDEEEAREHSNAILGMDIKGFTVHEVWIEGASEIEAEYYASIIFDRSAKMPLIMLSTKGGMDIEAVADEDPERDRHAARRRAAGLSGLPRPPARLRRGHPGRPRAARRRVPAPPLRRRSSPRRRR